MRTLTIVGNVLNAPDCRRIVDSQALVAHFKVASTSRRFDRAGERWVDGDSLRVRVNCWRQLAENVARSVQVGDPVIVTGRLYSRDWETEDHVRRVSYELDAQSVGHDLSRGRAKFARVKPHTLTSAIDDELAEARIGETPTAPADEINGLPRRRAYDEDLGGYVTIVEEDDPFAGDVLAALDEAGAEFERTDEELAAELEALAAGQEEDEPEEAEDSSDPAEEEGTVHPPRGRKGPRSRVPAGV
ncbi:single-stranded DNA-binding protein [Dactylosporangium salmoneum]|uniref:single-stranded DNA-binding protein n=1 Tax=Dactylosporangium salmoneum TaxID=53361 RepID=UPI0031E1C245